MDYDLDTPSTSKTIACGSLTVGSPLEFSSFSFENTSNFGPGVYDLIQSNTSLPVNFLGGSTSGPVDGYPANLSVSGNELVFTVVPEPGTLVLSGGQCHRCRRMVPMAKTSHDNRVGLDRPIQVILFGECVTHETTDTNRWPATAK